MRKVVDALDNFPLFSFRTRFYKITSIFRVCGCKCVLCVCDKDQLRRLRLRATGVLVEQPEVSSALHKMHDARHSPFIPSIFLSGDRLFPSLSSHYPSNPAPRTICPKKNTSCHPLPLQRVGCTALFGRSSRPTCPSYHTVLLLQPYTCMILEL